MDTPVLFLDNEFRDPDLERYVDRFHRYDPDVAVIGDAYTADEAAKYQEVIDELASDVDATFIVAPKCAAAAAELADDTVLGYPAGYSDVQGEDLPIEVWRGRDVHILGGSPTRQHTVIDVLTQPTLDDQAPSNIVGLDGNGVYKAAYFGEYWTPTGYERADHLSIRETVRRSLTEMRDYWNDRGVWPVETPVERYGPAVTQPDELIWMDDGGDPVRTREELEAAAILDAGEDVVACRSEAAKRFLAYREFGV